MRKIYFARHGLPYFPGGEKLCIGTTDVELSPQGRMQGVILGEYLKNQGFSGVYSSPRIRALDTAKLICPSPIVIEDLGEMHAGEWEGLPFSLIKERYPELYRLRGENRNLPIPGAESVDSGKRRFSRALKSILDSSEGDIVIVSHISVLQAYLCGFMGVSASLCRNIIIPHGSLSVFEYGESLSLVQGSHVPQVPLSDSLCEKLMEAAGAGGRAALHCRKTAEKAMQISDALQKAGYRLNQDALRHAALLHDIAKGMPCHAQAGAEWLELLGYSSIGKIVSSHHSILPLEINEAAVLAMADRCISETEEVSIEERFMRSGKKLQGEDAEKAHRERFENAIALRKLINGACGAEIIH